MVEADSHLKVLPSSILDIYKEFECIDMLSIRSWLAMSANVSVGYTPQTTDIFVCLHDVGNVVPTRRQHSVMSANFLAVGVVTVRSVADTHSYMYIGISTDEVVTTYEVEKKRLVI